jgi:ketosteroid isomerase-like protein
MEEARPELARQPDPDALHTAFQEAFNRHDLDAVVSFYEPTAVLFSSGAVVEGAQRIRDFYRRLFELKPHLTLRTLKSFRSGELALLHGEWSWRATNADGNQMARQGRSVEVVRLQPDGRWQYVIDDPSSS